MYLTKNVFYELTTEFVPLHIIIIHYIPVSLRDAVISILVTAAKLFVIPAKLQVELGFKRGLEVQTLRMSRCISNRSDQ